MTKYAVVEERPVLSPHELARRWGLHYRTIVERIHQGEIPSFKVGRNIRIPLDWVKEQENEPLR